MFISCGVYTYSFNEIGLIFNEITKNKRLIKKNIQIINKYMDNKNINNLLQHQVREYL